MVNLVSMYSGAGGLDYGFEAAGFCTTCCVENDADCARSLRASRPSRRVAEVDVMDAWPTDYGRPREVDVLAGGPPCQPFSKSGFWKSGECRRMDDPRSRTLEKMLDAVEILQPNVMLLENVAGIAYEGKDEGAAYVAHRLAGINSRIGTNYVPRSAVLDASAYGVPQRRSRYFLVAARSGQVFDFPVPTHGPGLLPVATAWDAIGDFPEPPEDLSPLGKWGRLLPSIPEGQNYLWHTRKGGGLPLFGWRTRYWNFLLKLAKDQPSWTIQAQPGPAVGPFHWRSRRLSTTELCRLMTFPSDMIVCGGDTSVRKQIGNAVPSLMAEVLAREIGRQFFGMRFNGDPKLSVPRRGTPPPPEPTSEVPEEYLSLVGDHGDHPGVGMGPGRKLTPSLEPT